MADSSPDSQAPGDTTPSGSDEIPEQAATKPRGSSSGRSRDSEQPFSPASPPLPPLSPSPTPQLPAPPRPQHLSATKPDPLPTSLPTIVTPVLVTTTTTTTPSTTTVATITAAAAAAVETKGIITRGEARQSISYYRSSRSGERDSVDSDRYPERNVFLTEGGGSEESYEENKRVGGEGGGGRGGGDEVETAEKIGQKVPELIQRDGTTSRIGESKRSTGPRGRTSTTSDDAESTPTRTSSATPTADVVAKDCSRDSGLYPEHEDSIQFNFDTFLPQDEEDEEEQTVVTKQSVPIQEHAQKPSQEPEPDALKMASVAHASVPLETDTGQSLTKQNGHLESLGSSGEGKPKTLQPGSDTDDAKKGNQHSPSQGDQPGANRQDDSQPPVNGNHAGEETNSAKSGHRSKQPENAEDEVREDNKGPAQDGHGDRSPSGADAGDRVSGSPSKPKPPAVPFQKPSPQRMAELDRHVLAAPRQLASLPIHELARYLLTPTRTEVESAYVIFRWVTCQPVIRQRATTTSASASATGEEEEEKEEKKRIKEKTKKMKKKGKGDEDEDEETNIHTLGTYLEKLQEGRMDHADMFSLLCKCMNLETHKVTGQVRYYCPQPSPQLCRARPASWSALLLPGGWGLVDCDLGARLWASEASNSRNLQLLPAHNRGRAQSSSVTSGDDGDKLRASSSSSTSTAAVPGIKMAQESGGGGGGGYGENRGGGGGGDLDSQMNNRETSATPTSTSTTTTSATTPSARSRSGTRTESSAMPFMNEFHPQNFYFLPPAQLVLSSHLPDNPCWQLVSHPLADTDFHSSLLRKPYLHYLGADLASPTSLRLTDISEETEVTWKLKGEGPRRFAFRFFHVGDGGGGDGDGGGGEGRSGPNRRELSRHGFLENRQSTGEVNLRLVPPVSGRYVCELYGAYVPPGAIHCSEMLHMCSFDMQFVKTTSTPLRFPHNERVEWGPGAECAALGMTPLTHPSGRVNVDKGEARVVFSCSRPLLLTQKLFSAAEGDEEGDEEGRQSRTEIPGSSVNFRDAQNNVKILLRIPDPGDYVLSVYGKEDSSPGKCRLLCNYLVLCRSGLPHVVRPFPPGLPFNKLGPTKAFSDLKLKLVCPKRSCIVVAPYSGKVTFVFSCADDLVQLSCDLLHQGHGGEEVTDSAAYVQHTCQSGESVFRARLPLPGDYLFHLYGKPSQGEGHKFLLYSALIECAVPNKDCLPLARVVPEWRARVQILAPLRKTLVVGAVTHFAVRAFRVKAVAVVGHSGIQQRFVNEDDEEDDDEDDDDEKGKEDEVVEGRDDDRKGEEDDDEKRNKDGIIKEHVDDNRSRDDVERRKENDIKNEDDDENGGDDNDKENGGGDDDVRLTEAKDASARGEKNEAEEPDEKDDQDGKAEHSVSAHTAGESSETKIERKEENDVSEEKDNVIKNNGGDESLTTIDEHSDDYASKEEHRSKSSSAKKVTLKPEVEEKEEDDDDDDDDVEEVDERDDEWHVWRCKVKVNREDEGSGVKLCVQPMTSSDSHLICVAEFQVVTERNMAARLDHQHSLWSAAEANFKVRPDSGHRSDIDDEERQSAYFLDDEVYFSNPLGDDNSDTDDDSSDDAMEDGDYDVSTDDDVSDDDNEDSEVDDAGSGTTKRDHGGGGGGRESKPARHTAPAAARKPDRGVPAQKKTGGSGGVVARRPVNNQRVEGGQGRKVYHATSVYNAPQPCSRRLESRQARTSHRAQQTSSVQARDRSGARAGAGGKPKGAGPEPRKERAGEKSSSHPSGGREKDGDKRRKTADGFTIDQDPATREKTLRRKLWKACQRREREAIKKTVRHYTRGGYPPCPDLTEAERLLHLFQLQDALTDALSSHDLGAIRQALTEVERHGYAGEMSVDCRKADALLSPHRHPGCRMRVTDGQLQTDLRTVREMRSYRCPPSVVHSVLSACLLLMGFHEGLTKTWTRCLRRMQSLGGQGVLRKMSRVKDGSLHPEIAARARQLLDKHSPQDAHNAGPGALALYQWANKVSRAGTVAALDEAYNADGDHGPPQPASKRRQREIFRELQQQPKQSTTTSTGNNTTTTTDTTTHQSSSKDAQKTRTGKQSGPETPRNKTSSVPRDGSNKDGKDRQKKGAASTTTTNTTDKDRRNTFKADNSYRSSPFYQHNKDGTKKVTAKGGASTHSKPGPKSQPASKAQATKTPKPAEKQQTTTTSTTSKPQNRSEGYTAQSPGHIPRPKPPAQAVKEGGENRGASSTPAEGWEDGASQHQTRSAHAGAASASQSVSRATPNCSPKTGTGKAQADSGPYTTAEAPQLREEQQQQRQQQLRCLSPHKSPLIRPAVSTPKRRNETVRPRPTGGPSPHHPHRPKTTPTPLLQSTFFFASLVKKDDDDDEDDDEEEVNNNITKTFKNFSKNGSGNSNRSSGAENRVDSRLGQRQRHSVSGRRRVMEITTPDI